MINASVGAGGANAKDDVRTVQRLLNKHLGKIPPLPKLTEDGIVGPRTLTAIEAFQRKVVKLQRPDRRVDVNGPTVKELQKEVSPAAPESESSPQEEPSWVKIGRTQLGIKEFKAGNDWAGLHASNNPEILKYLALYPGLAKKPARHRAAGSNLMMSMVDETAWCAAFVNWCLIQAGKRGGSSMAQNWAKYGTPEKTGSPRIGAITVTKRPPTPTTSGYHVGFYMGGSLKLPSLLGGNQGNKVCIQEVAATPAILSVTFRWPE